MAIFKTAAAFADFIGVSPSAVYKAKKDGKVQQTESGEYDSNDPINRKYIIGVSEKAKAQRGFIDPTAYPDDENGDLMAEKIKADTDYKKKQSVKLDIQIAKEKEEIVPIDLVAMWIGFFSQGIRNNFLQIGTRIAKGDKKLRQEIDKDVSRCIEKTLANAERQLKTESKKLVKELNND